jgi:hypothetical protein
VTLRPVFVSLSISSSRAAEVWESRRDFQGLWERWETGLWFSTAPISAVTSASLAGLLGRERTGDKRTGDGMFTSLNNLPSATCSGVVERARRPLSAADAGAIQPPQAAVW